MSGLKIPFNKPYLTGNESDYIAQSVMSGKLSGNGDFTKKCHQFFENKYDFGKCLLTSSGTDALEMCAVLLDLKEGDEVILPSFTFVSTAIPFLMRGASLVFADSSTESPNVEAEQITPLINSKTKAIVVMHYAGVACDMDKILHLANKHKLIVVEDAALSIDSKYKERALGSIGHLAAFSFHETKNIISGEGGMLVVNDERFYDRAEIIWEKGTNRAAFSRGDVSQYGWKDIGSSYLPSEITAAFLSAQLDQLKDIQQKRTAIWNKYHRLLSGLLEKGKIRIPQIPAYATINASLFYVLAENKLIRDALIKHLNENGIQAVFHYLPLHESDYFKLRHDGRVLNQAINYAEQIIRLPFYPELKEVEIQEIVSQIERFFGELA